MNTEEWSKSTKQKIVVSSLVIIVAFLFFALI